MIIAGKTQVIGHVTASVNADLTPSAAGGKHPQSTPTHKNHGPSPTAKTPASASPKEPSKSNKGLTIAGFTTIGKPTKPAGSFPTAGSGAIDALKPVASSALKAIRDAQSAAKQFSQNHSPSSGDVRNILDHLCSAFKGLSGLKTVADDIELTSFSGEDIPKVKEVRSGLGNLIDAVFDDTTGLGQWATSTSKGLKQLPKLATQLAGVAGGFGATGGVLLAISQWHPTSPAQKHRKPDPASLTLSSSTSKPTAWILNTVPGTSVKAFDAFIKTLPDKGAGRRIVYPHLSDQCYIGKMTLAQAKLVSKIPIVDQLSPATGTFKHAAIGHASGFSNRTVLNSTTIDGRTHKRSRLKAFVEFGKPLRQKRDRAFTVINRDGTFQQVPYHLRLLSLWKDRNLMDRRNTNVGYLYEATAGAESFVYVLDSGIQSIHPEFGLSLEPEKYTATAPMTQPGVHLGDADEGT